MLIRTETSDEAEAKVAAEFAKLLAVNFAREVGGKASSESALEAEQSLEVSLDPGAKIESTRNASSENQDNSELTGETRRSLSTPSNNRKGPRLASSRFRGCTRHRRTKRYEAHIWDQRQQRYLGGFDREIDAGKAHDVMALKCRVANETPQLNFPIENYAELIPLIDCLPKEEVVAQLRQLNRTAPRPKARKTPPKSKSFLNLTSLGTRSGSASKKTKPKVFQDSHLDNALQKYRVEIGSHEGHARNHSSSSIHGYKDSLWDPVLALDCPMSQEYSGALHQLGDPSDLLAMGETQQRHLNSPTISTPPPLYYRSSPACLRSAAPLFLGKAITTPTAGMTWVTRDSSGQVTSCFRMRTPPQPNCITGKPIYESLWAKPGMRSHSQPNMFRSLISDQSLQHSFESDNSHFDGLTDGLRRLGQHNRQLQHSATWSQPYHMRAPTPPQHMKSLDFSDCQWEHSLSSANNQHGLQQKTASMLGLPGPWEPSTKGWQAGQQPSLLTRTLEHQNSFNKDTQKAGPQWEKGAPPLQLQEGRDDKYGLSQVPDTALPQMDDASNSGMSFTDMMTQELPATDLLDAAVLDAMGSWSP